MALKREITRADILPVEQYTNERREHRRRISEVKRNRRIEVGPFCTFYFESYDTMWHQIHEMLYIERGGEQQIADELAAYNPLVPKGDELIATVMFEIDDPAQRERALARLGGVEHHMFLSVAGERVAGVPDPTRENTTPDGKASSVQFLRFPLSESQKARFRAPGTQVMVGIDHASYGHLAVMPEGVRAALAQDLG
ncbi:MAG TPA: DUF3501 family protein [Stellaceae bacterium]|nr:DUF3501 family protein [Stellaceae bacterium]